MVPATESVNGLYLTLSIYRQWSGDLLHHHVQHFGLLFSLVPAAEGLTCLACMTVMDGFYRPPGFHPHCTTG